MGRAGVAQRVILLADVVEELELVDVVVVGVMFRRVSTEATVAPKV